MTITTTERRETLTRERRRLATFFHRHPINRELVRDKRITIDALEQLILIDFKKEIPNVEASKAQKDEA